MLALGYARSALAGARACSTVPFASPAGIQSARSHLGLQALLQTVAIVVNARRAPSAPRGWRAARVTAAQAGRIYEGLRCARSWMKRIAERPVALDEACSHGGEDVRCHRLAVAVAVNHHPARLRLAQVALAYTGEQGEVALVAVAAEGLAP